MIYTKMTIEAMKIAYNAHSAQVDSNGVPYIFHPYHLAEQMDDEVSCTVALLYDVVEDTGVTIEELKEKFPKEVIDVVILMTHTPDVDYFDYLAKIKENPIAKKVKLADINHNSDVTRNAAGNVSEEKLKYWQDKYTKAKAFLIS